MGRSVRIIDEYGKRQGFKNKSEAEGLVSRGLAYQISARCFRLIGEDRPGQWRAKKSGHCGPVVLQYEQ